MKKPVSHGLNAHPAQIRALKSDAVEMMWGGRNPSRSENGLFISQRDLDALRAATTAEQRERWLNGSWESDGPEVGGNR